MKFLLFGTIDRISYPYHTWGSSTYHTHIHMVSYVSYVTCIDSLSCVCDIRIPVQQQEIIRYVRWSSYLLRCVCVRARCMCVHVGLSIRRIHHVEPRTTNEQEQTPKTKTNNQQQPIPHTTNTSYPFLPSLP